MAKIVFEHRVFVRVRIDAAGEEPLELEFHRGLA
jgi:hypothetical protein